MIINIQMMLIWYSKWYIKIITFYSNLIWVNNKNCVKN